MMTRLDNELRSAMLTRRMSRRSILKSSLMAGAGALALSTFGGAGKSYFNFAMREASAAPLDSDLDILNYALTLEYLETAAYKTINDAGVLTGRASTYFKAFGDHEAQHVDALMKTIQQLGGMPVAMPTFDFSSVPTDAAGVVKFFQMVEAVGASAYLGAAPSIQNADVLTAAIQIHAVEAEHASALADLVAPGTDLFSPAPFGPSRTPDEVLKIVAPFLSSSSGGSMPGMPNTGEGGMSRMMRDQHSPLINR
jgi:hypothetical protein